MKHICNNPFRILGLPITASEREIAKQTNMLTTYSEMGKAKPIDSDFPFLPPTHRTSEAIEEAKKQIEQSENKMLSSLFWFWNNNSVDELALEVLREGNTDKAISIWEKSLSTHKKKVYKPVTLIENLINQSTDWIEQSDEDYSIIKSNYEYIIERKKGESYLLPSVFAEFNYAENWTIECDTTWINGVDDEGYGIVFGREKGSFYFFGIAGSDSFIYAKFNEWTYTPLINWKDTPKFNKWGSNNLKIEKIESKLSFFVNGVNVGSWEVEPFFGKNFGFKVNSRQKISFKNFKFCRLIEDETWETELSFSSKKFSSIKNLSTLYLGLSLESKKGTFALNHFRNGIALAQNIFTNGNMEEYAKLIVGGRYNCNLEKIFHFYINNIIDSVKPFLDKTEGISINEILSLFSTFPNEAKQILNNRLITKQIQNIDKEIKTTESIRITTPEIATDAGKNLVKSTKTDINYLKKSLGEEDFQYQIIADKLSFEIGYCGIYAYNTFKTPDGDIDYAKAIRSEESYLHEYGYALTIASSQRAKDKAKINWESCKQSIEDRSYLSCWFCGKNPPDETSKFEVTIYKVDNRDSFHNIFDLTTRRKVYYSYIPIKIPRCEACETFHDRLFYFESATINFEDSEEYGLFSLVIYLFLLIIDGFQFIIVNSINLFVRAFYKMFMPSMPKLKDTKESTIRHFPPLKKRLHYGWQFSEPTG